MRSRRPDPDADGHPSAGGKMKVLVVEDDAETRDILQAFLADTGLDVRTAATLAEAKAALSAFDPDVCLTDLKLPDGDGLDLLREAGAGGSARETVVLTGHGSIDTAIEAMKAGAFDFLLKPLRPSQLEAVFDRLKMGARDTNVDEDLWKTFRESGRFGAIVGASTATQELCAIVSRLARSDAPVMITGESGSGKEVAAQTIHALSRRRHKALVAINCGAVSANLVESELFGHERGAFTGADKRRVGYFEVAREGTLFLDEVTEMSAELQIRFLRILETRTFRRVGGNEEISTDVRIISSSNRDPLEAIEKKVLREDLYYRLNVLPIHILPLRERPDDVPILAKHFLDLVTQAEGGSRRRFSAGTLDRLAAHSWPGNVRELRNVVHRAYVLSDGVSIEEAVVQKILSGHPSGSFPAVQPTGPSIEEATVAPPAAPEASDGDPVLPESGIAPLPIEVRVGDSLRDVERRLLERTLEAVGGNKRKAAEMLRVSLKTIYNKLKEFQIEG